ncbi:MAG: RNA polymerase factor sigma-54 [Gammaproteobacteria bacterium]
MSAAPGIAHRLVQRQSLAPGLAESLRLLALPGVELARAIEAALEANVMLDRGEAEAPLDPTPDAASDTPLASEQSRPASRADGAFPEDNEAEAEDLRTHLTAQLVLEHFSVREFAAAEVVIDALDEDGYLRTSNAALAASLEDLDPPATHAEIETAIRHVQNLEPTGIAARNAAECLLLQLAERPRETPGYGCAETLLHNHFAALARGDAAALAKLAGSTPTETHAALALIHGLDPHPGYCYSTARIEYLLPELTARRAAAGWRVEINAAVSPRLYVNEAYAGWLATNRDADGAQTLATQLDEARLLVANLAQRRETLLRVGQALADRQTGFLATGPQALLPLTMRTLAEALELHESTISRAVQGKSIDCPRGVIPLRHFFSASVSHSSEDGGQASRAIQAQIGALIAAENPTAPLSDAALANVLAGDGVRVARRTVTKYREALGLASTRERRRPAR